MSAEQSSQSGHPTWDTACATAWDKWFGIIEGAAAPLSDRMVERAGIAEGHRVLDIATGVGEPAVTAARKAGASGHVLATDLSPDMLAFGRRRAEREGLSNIEFRELDASRIDLPAASFDAVLCRWGLMFLTDLAPTLAAIHHVLVPGGAFVASVWGPAEGAPMVGLSDRVMRAHLGLPAPDEGPGSPFALQDTAAFERQVASAGFQDVIGEWFTVTSIFESRDQFVEFRRDRAGAMNKELERFSPEDQEAAWQIFAEAIARFETPDGSLRVPNRACCVAGRKAG